MKLLEYRGKELLKKVGIRVPVSILTDNKSYINLSYYKERYKEFFLENKVVVVKAQVIMTGRKKAKLIQECNNYEESLEVIDALYKQGVKQLLIEKKLNLKEEFFLAIRYNTVSRTPTIYLSKKGGIDVVNTKDNKIAKVDVNPIHGLRDFEARKVAKEAGFIKKDIFLIASFIKKAYRCFDKYDCKNLEINPIIKTDDDLLYAGDAKITIDDSAISRNPEFADVTDVEDSSFLNERELEARRIDMNDYRGVSGKTYMDFDGNIAILASGGGVSLACMDSVLEAGGKPANYTEYSGNPPKDKVYKISKLVLSKPNLKGCLVIGGTANFTDIYETLSGFMEALQSLPEKPTYPIVIRRAGPRDKEAFKMVREIIKKEGYNITLYGEEMAITEACKIMVDKAND